jgi:hypothetical protein
MLDAMSQVGVEHIIIEDLVDFGEDRGMAKALLKLLAQRFGSVPEGFETRVRSAREAELDRWLERVLTAASLDEVFAD